MARRSYPPDIEFEGERYVMERVLKEDFFSVNVLYRARPGAGLVLKISDCRFVLGFLFQPLAAMLSRHEEKIYRRLQGIPGIPKLGPRIAWRAFFHEFAEGHTLFEHDKSLPFPPRFFERLLELMREIHGRSVIHLDSNKCGNIIVGNDGRPYIIDFQVSLDFGRMDGPLRGWKRRLFQAFVREDIYHVHKRKLHASPGEMTEEELRLTRRSSANSVVKRLLGDPYRVVKRLVYPSGSNDRIWYKLDRRNKEEFRQTD